MGQIRDKGIRDFQKRAGIQPALGERAEALSKMSKRAYDLIQVIALEQSGIRDGDGYWSGGDPIASIVHDIARLEREDLAAWRATSSQRTEKAAPCYECGLEHLGPCGEMTDDEWATV